MAVKGPDLKKTILSCVSVADVPYDVFRSRTYEQKCPIDANISFEEGRGRAAGLGSYLNFIHSWWFYLLGNHLSELPLVQVLFIHDKQLALLKKHNGNSRLTSGKLKSLWAWDLNFKQYHLFKAA